MGPVILEEVAMGVQVATKRTAAVRFVGVGVGVGVGIVGPVEAAAAVGADTEDVVAAMGVGQEALAALRHPLHRLAAQLARGPEAGDLFAVGVDLGAEAAADIGCHDPQLVLRRQPDEGGQDQPGDMRVLAGGVEHQLVGAGIVLADRRTGLHRVRDQAVVDQVDLGHMGGLGEGLLDPFAVAELPVVAEIAGRLLVQLRGVGFEGLLQVDAGGKRLVVDLHRLGRIFRLAQALRDHHRDRLADMAHLAFRQDWVLRFRT